MEEPENIHRPGTFLQGATMTVVFLYQCSISENLADIYCLVRFIGVSIPLAYGSARVYGGVLVLPYVKAPCE